VVGFWASLGLACGSSGGQGSEDASASAVDAALADAAAGTDVSQADATARPDASLADALSAADALTGHDATSAPDAAPSPDAAPARDASGASVELGTGQSQFTPLMNGDTVAFNPGPQGGGRYGGYNIWGAVSAHGVDPAGVTVNFTMTSSGGHMLGGGERELTLVPSGADEVAFGLPVILDDCCIAIGKAIALHLQLKDLHGGTFTDDRHVQGASSCPPNPFDIPPDGGTPPDPCQ
jgi:hypothetical protein